ncbi:hypothetical protein H8A97_30480 [Bradyrhizobium sp. Arg62]|uniref:hypothetical protein n=1 Tax=Bradyrhizobium brasilense TaxID=1419277 RepID=UPI001E4CB55C|nr:hypothetical protein [Bradyrhizobium brasilense]MCC8949313.1 hypothetical protein [Bradyrhizobium brasilense]
MTLTLDEKLSGAERCAACEQRLADALKALKAVEDWWLTEGMKHFDGAPYAIFAARAALQEPVDRIDQPTTDRLDRIDASLARQLSESIARNAKLVAENEQLRSVVAGLQRSIIWLIVREHGGLVAVTPTTAQNFRPHLALIVTSTDPSTGNYLFVATEGNAKGGAA